MTRLLEAWKLIEAFSKGDLDPVDHAMEVYDRVQRYDREYNAYVSLESIDVVLEQAVESRKRYREGRQRRLEGLIIGVKDNISTNFLPTTAASRMLDGYVPPFNATVVERIIREGGIVIGKTNLDEFAMGSTTELSAFFPTRNPWDPGRVPGGSSGGSAAALAYGGSDLALGSDTGGSARAPAAYTATVGLKPTYGLVSRYGLIPYANSLEQIAPMARSVRDVALLLEVIAGFDPKDATTLNVERIEVSGEVPEDPGKVSICVIPELLEGAEKPIVSAFNKLVGKLEAEGSRVMEAKLPAARYALPAYYTIAFSEAASNLARYDGVLYKARGDSGVWEEYVSQARRKGFGEEVRRRILMGTFALSEGYREEYYVAATRLRRVIRDEVLSMASRCVIATPAMPVMPPHLGERVKDPIQLYLMDAYTVIANLSGAPALVQPIDFFEGLPIGIQWIGNKLGERELIRLGLLVEEITGIRGVVAVG